MEKPRAVSWAGTVYPFGAEDGVPHIPYREVREPSVAGLSGEEAGEGLGAVAEAVDGDARLLEHGAAAGWTSASPGRHFEVLAGPQARPPPLPTVTTGRLTWSWRSPSLMPLP